MIQLQRRVHAEGYMARWVKEVDRPSDTVEMHSNAGGHLQRLCK